MACERPWRWQKGALEAWSERQTTPDRPQARSPAPKEKGQHRSAQEKDMVVAGRFKDTGGSRDTHETHKWLVGTLCVDSTDPFSKTWYDE